MLGDWQMWIFSCSRRGFLDPIGIRSLTETEIVFFDGNGTIMTLDLSLHQVGKSQL